MKLLERFRDPARAFRAWGVVGYASGCAVGAAIATANSLDLALMAALAAAAAGTFFALALGSALVGGSTRLVYYYHELAILIVAGGIVAALHRPVLPYLDATALSVGTFLAFGRIGCLTVGCCHGRPAGRGRRYTRAHAVHGFPGHLVGVRLVPVQAIESASVAAIVAVGVPLALAARPGTALVWYVAAYGIARFALEYLRGDAERPYWLGFSQAQWFSLGLVGASSLGSVAGVLPHLAWDAAPVVLVAAMVVQLFVSGGAELRRLVAPHHTAELAALLGELRDGSPLVRSTSLGLRISAPAREIYTLSRDPAPLERAQANAVAARIAHLRLEPRHAVAPGAHQGVFHLLLGSATRAQAPPRPRAAPSGERPTS